MNDDYDSEKIMMKMMIIMYPITDLMGCYLTTELYILAVNRYFSKFDIKSLLKVKMCSFLHFTLFLFQDQQI